MGRQAERCNVPNAEGIATTRPTVAIARPRCFVPNCSAEPNSTPSQDKSGVISLIWEATASLAESIDCLNVWKRGERGVRHITAIDQHEEDGTCI